ncbi:MAG: hypothetical protein ABEJ65_08735 [bacterium]
MVTPYVLSLLTVIAVITGFVLFAYSCFTRDELFIKLSFLLIASGVFFGFCFYFFTSPVGPITEAQFNHQSDFGDILAVLIRNSIQGIGSTLGTILVAAVGGISAYSLWVNDKIQIRTFFRVQKKSLTLEFDHCPVQLYRNLDFKYLLIRFGTDDFLRDTATLEEKKELGLQNKTYNVRSSYDEQNQSLRLELPIRKHKLFGSQFKLFALVKGDLSLDEAKEYFQNTSQVEQIDSSEDLEGQEKLWFLLDIPKVQVVTTPEGHKNNHV